MKAHRLTLHDAEWLNGLKIYLILEWRQSWPASDLIFSLFSIFWMLISV